MKIVAFAYHDVGIVGLESLTATGNDILHIFSHEDDPRELVWFGSVVAWAKERKISCSCPTSINDGEVMEIIKSLNPDAIFSFYYRNMIGEAILAIPPLGAYNLHGSLLPQYRGRVPINWALINGEKETGVTLHHMVVRADAGDIVAQRAFPIAEDDTALTLYQKLCLEARVLLQEFVPLIATKTAPRIKQDLSKGGYYGKRTPEDGRIDWEQGARSIYNLIRAVTHPYPGAFCFLSSGEKMLVWWARPCGEDHSTAGAGEVLLQNGAVCVGTGGGGLVQLEEIEIAGGIMNTHEIFRFFEELKGVKLQ
ncbi:MAG: formyltransferase [Deltaproteobacteria bacterium]|nr:formyltransferase [Deltaproteobacteria bacterium]